MINDEIMAGRTIAIGDIHGCSTAFETLLDMLQVTSEDTIVLLGDIVDRGPGTKQVIETTINLKSRCKQLIYIRGNHEEMLLDALKAGPLTSTWLFYGGQEVLDSYEIESVEQLPESHVNFIESSRDYWENQTDIFVHANVQHDRPLDEQHPQVLRWERYTGTKPPHFSGKRVIVGHTVMPQGMPKFSPGWLAIDTGAYEGNPLTAFDTTTKTFYQADESGNRYPTFPLVEEPTENP
ncbi:Serine/threonine-protein phosphatase 1 [Polystyrenella longa]|uniref:Serine/threonine-protein phosphatase 1 n=1 Tax=Polystyrenella longa TaxID=2528007 RepID=A0A518CPS3_9PLAN|nr:metallophosphoesterase family protein [Polystyrenella longa]QDU81219.1 Serine/threonine-protein phosphatase 1 [Polystyrenella longa]